MESKRLLTVREVAELMGVKPLTVYFLVRSGKLRAVRLEVKASPRSIRVRPEDVDAYVAALKPYYSHE